MILNPNEARPIIVKRSIWQIVLHTAHSALKSTFAVWNLQT